MLNKPTNLFKQPVSGNLLFTLGIMCIFIFIFNYLTPEYIDDYLYKFQYVHGDPSLSHPIDSFLDIINSQIDHYFNYNGRFSVHILVQLFTGIIGKTIFNIFNTIVFLLFIIGICRYTFKDVNVSSVLISLAIFFLGMPYINETSLWMTGSINYLWTATGLIYFLLYLKRHKHRRFHRRHIFGAILCFFLGLTHEGLTVPLAIGLVFYTLQHKYHKSNDRFCNLVFFFGIGACACFFSPGLMSTRLAQAAQDGGIGFARIAEFALVLISLKEFWALLFVLLFLTYKHKFSEFFKRNSDLLVAVLVSVCIVLFVGGLNNRRAIFIVELYAMILILRAIAMTDYRQTLIDILATLYLLAISCSIGYYSYLNYQNNQNIISQVKTSETGIIKVEDVSIPNILQRYICPALPDNHSIQYRNYNAESTLNQCMARTYDRDSLTFLPNIFFKQLDKDPKVYTNFNVKSELPFYCRALKKGEVINTIKFKFNSTDFNQLPWYIRPVAHKFQRFSVSELETSDFDIINIDETKYVFVKRLQTIDFRINSIETE